MKRNEEGKSVTYIISDDSYWSVGKYSSMCKMGKSEFINRLISEYSDELSEKINSENVYLGEDVSLDPNDYVVEYFDGEFDAFEDYYEKMNSKNYD